MRKCGPVPKVNDSSLPILSPATPPDEHSLEVPCEELKLLKVPNVRVVEEGCLIESPSLKRELLLVADEEETNSFEAVLLWKSGKYILLNVLLCSIAEYFMSCAVFWRAHGASFPNFNPIHLLNGARKALYRFSGVQIPRDIWTRFGRYFYSTKHSWIIVEKYFVMITFKETSEKMYQSFK